jgi:hypothetical protein
MCGGCRARSLAAEGDLLAADPSCTYEPPVGAPLIERTSTMAYGMPAPASMRWTPEATHRLERIPSFVRGVVARRLEDYARDHGLSEVSLDLMREVRRAMPIDFSKRTPFFAGDD